MAYNVKQIKLARVPDGYRVISVKNSTSYDPVATLSRDEVEGMCRNAAWDVTIVGAKETA